MCSPTLLFDPLDTLMFRDGRPFNQDDQGLGEARSLFPPMPETLYGAARAAIAVRHGWTGGDWSTDPILVRLLGSWADNGKLSTAGPVVIRNNRDAATANSMSAADIFLPAPAHLRLVGNSQSRRLEALAAPSSSPSDSVALVTDLGGGCMPPMRAGEEPRPAPLKSSHISLDLYEKVLNGTLAQWPPASSTDGSIPGVLGEHEFVENELRIGLERRKDDSRVVEEGMLYASSRKRLKPAFRIGTMIEGLDPSEIEHLPAYVPLGGEARAAFIELSNEPGRLLAELAKCVVPSRRYFIVLVTPALPRDLSAWRPGAELFADDRLPGRLVWAVTNKPYFYAGFRSAVGENKGGGIMRAVMPAGAVLFFEANAGEAPEPLKSLGRLARTTSATEAGYGRYLIGNW